MDNEKSGGKRGDLRVIGGAATSTFFSTPSSHPYLASAVGIIVLTVLTHCTIEEWTLLLAL
jgi:hypothetical protein